jgi:hypothetical protein
MYRNSFAAWLLPVLLVAGIAQPPVRAAENAGASADPAQRSFVALTPERAGADFTVQGEYLGEYTDAAGNKHLLGVQVAALGGGKFNANFLSGGLPGAGWDGTTNQQLDGETQGPETVFKTELADKTLYRATIRDGVLNGQTDKAENFSLKKTMRQSPTQGMKPPAGAVILFDGVQSDAMDRAFMDARKFLLVNLPSAEVVGDLIPEREKINIGGGPLTRQRFGDFSLHLEFLEPFKPWGRGQGRGNSGVYLQQRYEIQILDSFGFQLLGAKPVGDVCGEIYKQITPKLNMSFPPLSWQTYDIDFQQPRWNADGTKQKNAVITLRHNGVLVHDNVEITNKTGAGQAEGPEPRPILLQNHGEPVVFRNIWIVPRPTNG